MWHEETGQVILSKRRADFEKAWDRVIDAQRNGETLMAYVTERVKGGLVVDLGGDRLGEIGKACPSRSPPAQRLTLNYRKACLTSTPFIIY